MEKLCVSCQQPTGSTAHSRLYCASCRKARVRARTKQRKQTDPEYAAKIKARQKAYREKPESKEKMRVYIREWQAKRRAAQKAQSQPTTAPDSVCPF